MRGTLATLSFSKTLDSVRGTGARILCVCYISRGAQKEGEGSVTEQLATIVHHGTQGAARLRDNPLPSAPASLHRHGPGAGLPLPSPVPRRAPAGNPAQMQL